MHYSDSKKKRKEASKSVTAMGRIKKKKIQNELPVGDDTSNLPHDIVENILSRLPVKSLFQFKTVCKSWNAKISEPRFAKIQLEQSKKSDRQKLFMSTTDGFSLMGFKNMNIKVEAALCFPIKKYRKASILCSCDGLLLLKTRARNDKMFVLWNPSIRMFKTFSCPYTYNIDVYESVHGICYDVREDDYKVVFVTNKLYAVYSYKNNSWTDEKEFCYTGMRTDPGVYVNGVLHWVGIHKKVQGYRTINWEGYLMFEHEVGHDREYGSGKGFVHEIVCFDPIDNDFKKLLGKPHELEEDDSFNLTSLRNYLCVYRITSCEGGYGTKIQMWMMNKYGDQDSWTTIMICETLARGIKRPLCLMNEDNFVMEIEYLGFLIYNRKKKMRKEIKNTDRRSFTNVVTCLDSMFFPVRKA